MTEADKTALKEEVASSLPPRGNGPGVIDAARLQGAVNKVIDALPTAYPAPEAPQGANWIEKVEATILGNKVSYSAGSATFDSGTTTTSYTASSYTITLPSGSDKRLDAIEAFNDGSINHILGIPGTNVSTPALTPGSLWVSYMLLTSAGGTQPMGDPVVESKPTFSNEGFDI
jgi:hypothetical protein